MPLNAYLWIDGIDGPETRAERERSIRVIAASHEVLSPRDASTGMLTGRRQHTPFTITKEEDKSSPELRRLFSRDERIGVCLLEFWQSTRFGAERHYSVLLQNAVISAIRFEMLNIQYPENRRHKEREHISFIYETINWETPSGSAAQDDWYAPQE